MGELTFRGSKNASVVDEEEQERIVAMLQMKAAADKSHWGKVLVGLGGLLLLVNSFVLYGNGASKWIVTASCVSIATSCFLIYDMDFVINASVLSPLLLTSRVLGFGIVGILYVGDISGHWIDNILCGISSLVFSFVCWYAAHVFHESEFELMQLEKLKYDIKTA